MEEIRIDLRIKAQKNLPWSKNMHNLYTMPMTEEYDNHWK